MRQSCDSISQKMRVYDLLNHLGEKICFQISIGRWNDQTIFQDREKTQQLQSACMDYELLHGRRPTIAELAEIIGESENVTRNLLEALQRARIKSLDHPRNDDEKWTEQLKYDYDLESEVCQEVMNREFENMVIEVLQNETDRQIIDYVFEYADNDMTRSEIAESVGVSKQYICKRIIAIKELLRKKHII